MHIPSRLRTGGYAHVHVPLYCMHGMVLFGVPTMDMGSGYLVMDPGSIHLDHSVHPTCTCACTLVGACMHCTLSPMYKGIWDTRECMHSRVCMQYAHMVRATYVYPPYPPPRLIPRYVQLRGKKAPSIFTLKIYPIT